MIDWKKRDQERLVNSLTNDTYTGSQGELRWKSNNSVIMLDVFRDACMEPPVNQAKARDEYVTAEITAYLEAMKDYVPSAAEIYEMRASFGPGETVVNVLTRKKYKT